jgi:hypothetical protein
MHPARNALFPVSEEADEYPAFVLGTYSTNTVVCDMQNEQRCSLSIFKTSSDINVDFTVQFRPSIHGLQP